MANWPSRRTVRIVVIAAIKKWLCWWSRFIHHAKNILEIWIFSARRLGFADDAYGSTKRGRNMDSHDNYFRSPELMKVEDTVLLVVDVQEKLLPQISGRDRLVWNVGRLVDACRILGIRYLLTEQYPQGLGPTTELLRKKVESDAPIFEKTSFSCCGSDAFREQLAKLKPAKVLVTGMESHVCILQTVLDLLADGYRVLAAVDAIGARNAADHRLAIRRMETEGAVMTSTEASIFEWCETSKRKEFKQLQQLVVDSRPE